jgi:type III secretion protein J
MELYYFGEKNLEEVGAILGLSKSWACRLHARAVDLLEDGAGGRLMRAAFLLVLLLGCSTPIRHGLDEPAANEVVTALERAGIGAEKARDDASGPTMFVVRVASGDAIRALDVLHAWGCRAGRGPGSPRSTASPAWSRPPPRSGPATSRPLSGEIERTLETVDGVVSARVHLVLEEARRAGREAGARPRPPCC